jgi:uncharacterized protein
MGERASHAPGTFCWADLTTTDQDAAKGFYGALFGWEAEDLPVDDETTYSMMRMDGKNVAAIAPQPPQQRDAGVPPVWNSYVAVDSADATADKAKELGATVHAPPFDVMEAGRMAVIQDPQGAFFMAWQAKDNIGAQLVNAPGALTWNELASPDLDASAAFYKDLFGWETTSFEGGPMTYLTIGIGDSNNGGMREAREGEPPNWLVYFAVEDMDAALAKGEELGATKIAGPIEFQMGKIGVLQDPQGAVFALWAGELRP